MSDTNLTAADLIRKRSLDYSNKVELDKEKKVDAEKLDLDDEIKRLEAELANGESSSSSDSNEDSSSSSDDDDDVDGQDGTTHKPAVYLKRKKISFVENTILNKDELKSNNPHPDPSSSNSGVICVSQCAYEEIVPLPSNALPKCKSKKLKIDFDDNITSTTSSHNKSPQDAKKIRKRKRFKNNDDNPDDSAQNEGLREAVLEVLAGYKARSSERIPFYCRVCSHTSANEEEFFAHKKSEFHKAAVQIERKKTYCKLCRKQLTSIVQLQEHLNSKPHKERLELVKARQRGERVENFRGRGNRQNRDMQAGRGRGSGRGEYGSRSSLANDHRKRQWC